MGETTGGTVRIRTLGWIATTIVLSVLCTLLVTQAWSVGAAPGDTDSTFVPITPCRLFDTRPGEAPAGPKKTPLSAGDANALTQQVTGVVGNCIIPNTAVAVSMNVTIVNPTASSNLRVFPAGVPTPLVSNLNWSAGDAPTPNKVDVKLSTDGKLTFWNFSGNVDVLGDVVGYYISTSLKEISNLLNDTNVIPSGVTVTGEFDYDSAVIDYPSDHWVTIHLPGTAPAAITDAVANFSNVAPTLTDDEDASCTGSYGAPTAPPGKLCVYFESALVRKIDHMSAGNPSPTGLDKRFFRLSFQTAAGAALGDDMTLYVTWAYTAP
jgi:hypothetical protein